MPAHLTNWYDQHKTKQKVKTMNINKQSINKISDEINEVLNKHFSGQLSFAISGGSFSEDTAKLSLSLTQAGAKSDDQKDLELYSKLYNLDQKKIATMNGGQFQLVKYNTKAKKFPWVVQKLDEPNKRYKITQAQAVRLFHKPTTNNKGSFTSVAGKKV